MNHGTAARYAALASALVLAAACSREDAPRTGANAPGSPPAASNSAPNGPARPGSATPAAPSTPVPPAAAPTPPATPPPVAAQLVARADMMPVGDSTVRGTIEFQGGHASPLMIQVALMGLQAGSHGIHVHMGSDCANPGEHFNPDSAQHGAATGGADARHRGDLGNVTADASGVVQQMLRDPVLGTDHSFIGKVIVVHDRPDDLMTQPSGGSGEPVACGVIEEADTSVSRAPGGDRGV